MGVVTAVAGIRPSAFINAPYLFPSAIYRHIRGKRIVQRAFFYSKVRKRILFCRIMLDDSVSGKWISE